MKIKIITLDEAYDLKKSDIHVSSFTRTREGRMEHVGGFIRRHQEEKWKTKGSIKERSDLPDFMQRFYRGVKDNEIQIHLPHGIGIKEADKPVVTKAVQWLKDNGAEWKYAGHWVFKAGFMTSKG